MAIYDGNRAAEGFEAFFGSNQIGNDVPNSTTATKKRKLLPITFDESQAPSKDSLRKALVENSCKGFLVF